MLAQARDIARQAEQPLSSAHLLLALFTVPNLAELLLLDRHIDENAVLDQIECMEREPDDTLADLEDRSVRLADGCDHRQVNCLHLLGAMTRLPRSFAYRLLVRAGVPIPSLRTTTLRYATAGIPRRLLRSVQALDFDEPSPTDLDPELSADTIVDTVADTIVDEVDIAANAHTISDFDRREEEDLPVGETVSAPTTGRHRAERAADQVDAAAPRRGWPGPDRRNSGGGGRRAADDQRDGIGGGVAVRPRPPQPRDVSPYILNRERFRWLKQLGRNLSHLAYLGKLDPVIGRDREIEESIDVLNKRRSNNPCLVGEPGVGKTAVVEGIATRMVDEERARGDGPSRVLMQIDVGGILAGTHLRGSLAERLRGLQEEVRAANGAVIIFIDEIHALVGAGGGDGAHDAANELKAALARGEFPCIGATTIDEYRRHIESDPALERRFTSVHVDEPDEPTTLAILRGVADRYSDHHGVVYQSEAFEAAVRMSRRYVHDRRDPDKSLGVLDLAGAVARRAGQNVDRRAVAEVVARIARVPVDHLMVDDPQRFLEMESRLGERIVGQQHAIGAIAETIRRNFAGFAGARPIGSFLFLGPTGVGKTEAVKALAQFLFGDRDAMVRFDMSEYVESHSVSRLVGSPPGYVGHVEGGQLTDAVRRRPYQIVLFDELDKSHRDVWNLLLQVLDEGRLTDSRGKCADFSNTVVVLTSNLGAEVFDKPSGRRIGFADARDDTTRDERATRVLDRARGALPPELWNRIESRLVFHPLSRLEVLAIARLIVRERSELLHAEKGIGFEVDDAAIECLIDQGGYDVRLGARPMRQTIARAVEGPLAERILAGVISRGDEVRITAEDGVLQFDH